MNRTGLRGAALGSLVVAMLTGCSAIEDAATNGSSSANATSAGASTASQAGSSAADKPIGSAAIDLGGSASSLPPEKLSRPDATDCYAGESRIYDRHGVTCDQAREAMKKYDATPGAAKGTSAKIGAYTCSHNPEIMVVQGAAPATCADGSGNVVFNWRYPGAPQPAKS